jgi:hypothetical protein
LDKAHELTEITNELLDEGIMTIYDKTMDKLDEIGVSWDAKKLKRRNMI